MSTKISFTNRSGIDIQGRLDTPEVVKAYCIFAHCFTCNKNLNAVRNISRSLNKEGIAVFRFDFTGLGESDGEFEDSNFSSNIDDLIDASHFLKEKYGPASLMIGHSLGGAAVLFAANALEEIKAYATIGSPSQPEHVSHLLRSSEEEINEHGQAEVYIGGRSFQIKKQFIDDIKNRNAFQVLRDSHKPILILHSPHDKIVDISNASELYKHANHPKSFISLAGADHLLSAKEDSLYVGHIISAWAERYVF